MAAARIGPFVGESYLFSRPLLHQQLVRGVKKKKTESSMRLTHSEFLVQMTIKFCSAPNYIIVMVNQC